MFGVSDEIQDITRRSGMVRRIRFMYWKVIELFRKGLEGSGILWKVLEGSRRKSGVDQGRVGPSPGRLGPKWGAPGLPWPTH